MKVDEFLHPNQLTVDDCIAHAEEGKKVETVEESVRSLTPSGIEVFYSWAPRRHYKLRHHNPAALPLHEGVYDGEWIECPSVTTVLNVLDKSGAISWWAMRCGISAVIDLDKRKILPTAVGDYTLPDLERLVVDNKLSINHQTASAATRGVNVHSALEKWCEDTSFRPILDTYPESEQGYIRGLIKFLDDFTAVDDIQAEVMVGSIAHGYAGRFDLLLSLTTDTEVTTRVYPKRAAKREEVPAGRLLIDLKTSKNCYPSHALQLAAYELASIECGYGATDARYVVHVTAEGEYEFVKCNATPEDFLSVLAAHNTMQGSKKWLS